MITSEYTKGKNNEWFLSEVKRRGEHTLKTSHCRSTIYNFIYSSQKPLYCKTKDLNLHLKEKVRRMDDLK